MSDVGPSVPSLALFQLQSGDSSVQTGVHLTQLLATPLALSTVSQKGVPAGSINSTAGLAGALQRAKYTDT